MQDRRNVFRLAPILLLTLFACAASAHTMSTYVRWLLAFGFTNLVVFFSSS
jgi:hypothetical protein